MSNPTEISPSVVNNPEVSVNVVLNSPAIKLTDLSKLSVGEVIKLNQKIDEYLTIEINGKVVGRAELFAMDGVYALKVQEVSGG